MFGKKIAGHDTDLIDRVVAVRAALRALPGLSRLFQGEEWGRGREQPAAELIAAVRVIFVSWTSVAFDGVQADSLAATRTHIASALTTLDLRSRDVPYPGTSDYGRAAMENSMDAARRCLGLVGWAAGLPVTGAARDDGRKWLKPRHTVADLFDKRWSDVQLATEVRDRAAMDDGGETPRSLALAPLWWDRAHEAMAAIQWDDHGLVFVDAIRGWLRERTPGTFVLGKPPSDSATRFVAIANLPSSFWEDHPEDVAESLRYLLTGDMANAAWGVVRPSTRRTRREGNAARAAKAS